MLNRQVVIGLRDGLGFDSAAQFVKMAGTFSSKVFIEQRSRLVNAKSMMGVLSLGLLPGQMVLLSADGPDERTAMESLSKFLQG